MRWHSITQFYVESVQWVTVMPHRWVFPENERNLIFLGTLGNDVINDVINDDILDATKLPRHGSTYYFFICFIVCLFACLITILWPNLLLKSIHPDFNRCNNFDWFLDIARTRARTRTYTHIHTDKVPTEKYFQIPSSFSAFEERC